MARCRATGLGGPSARKMTEAAARMVDLRITATDLDREKPRLLDEVASVPATKGLMLTFDDFLIGMEQFGQHIQPLMERRREKLKAVA